MEWYIHSNRIDERYLNIVKSCIGEIMDWFCLEVNKIDNIDKSNISNILLEIFNKLPILNFKTNLEEDEFWIEYNSNTKIMFKHTLKSIRREIILKNILR